MSSFLFYILHLPNYISLILVRLQDIEPKLFQASVIGMYKVDDK